MCEQGGIWGSPVPLFRASVLTINQKGKTMIVTLKRTEDGQEQWHVAMDQSEMVSIVKRLISGTFSRTDASDFIASITLGELLDKSNRDEVFKRMKEPNMGHIGVFIATVTALASEGIEGDKEC